MTLTPDLHHPVICFNLHGYMKLYVLKRKELNAYVILRYPADSEDIFFVIL